MNVYIQTPVYKDRSSLMTFVTITSSACRDVVVSIINALISINAISNVALMQSVLGQVAVVVKDTALMSRYAWVGTNSKETIAISILNA